MKSNAKDVMLRLQARLDKKLKELPIVLMNEGSREFTKNFTTQSFGGIKWKARKDKKNHKPLLVGRTRKLINAVRMSGRSATLQKIVWGIGSDVPYASVHNFGGTINKGTRTHTLHYREIATNIASGKTLKRFAKQKGKNKATHSMQVNMKAHSFKMPQRQFMGVNKSLIDRLMLATNKIFRF